MCFWYQIDLPPGTGPVSQSATFSQSVLVGGDDLVAGRVVEPGLQEVVGV
jgi:hypothetical protein